MSPRKAGILASIVFAVLTMAVFVTMKADTKPVSAQPLDAIPQIDLAQMEKDFSEREAVYRQQMLDLSATLEERRMTYDLQIEALTQALAAGRSHLEGLNAQEVAAEGQLTQFNQALSERQGVFLTRRQETERSYNLRYNQMVAQLTEVQAKLVEAQQALGQ